MREEHIELLLMLTTAVIGGAILSLIAYFAVHYLPEVLLQ